MIDVEVPIVTTSKLNDRVHWAVKAKAARRERAATLLMLLTTSGPPPLPVTVTLTRVAPRELDDDNVRGALKCVRDEVASWLGVDDRDARVTWGYAQAKGQPGVRIRIEARNA